MTTYQPPPLFDQAPDEENDKLPTPQREKILRWGKIDCDTHAPATRHGHSSVIIGENMYIVAGMETNNRTNSVAVFNLKTKRWSLPLCDGTGRDVKDGGAFPSAPEDSSPPNPQPLPPARMHCGVFIWGPSIYIHGGEGAMLAPTKGEEGTDEYHLPEGNDDLTASFMKKKSFVEKVVLSDNRPPRTCLDDCWCLDTSSHPLTWKNIPSKLSPLPRKSHSTTVASHDGNACAILFGGAPSGKKAPSNALYWVRIADLEGTEASSMGTQGTRMAFWNRAAAKGTPPRPRYGHTATRLSNTQLAIFGGAAGDGELLNDLAILDTETFVWTLIGSWIGKEPAPRFGHCAAAVGSFSKRLEENEFVNGDSNSSCLIVFGGACLSSNAKDDEKSKRRFKRTHRRDGHVVYSYEINAFDFATREWKLIRSGVTHPSARYDCTLVASCEHGSAALLGAADPEAVTLTGANLNANIERDGGRYAILHGGFNSHSLSSECWALSLEWENQGCGGDDPAEFELRGGDFTSLVNEGNGRNLINSASTPTLAHDTSALSFASSNASTTIRFASDTKNPQLSHSASANDILSSMGVDVESIEKALTNFKREKIIASKEAAAERQERIRLEDIITDLREQVAKLEAERQKILAEMGEEGKSLRNKIREHQIKIDDLKIQIKEQQELMLRMDMNRVQEIGVMRHVKGAKSELMVDFAQPTVIEHELVRLVHDADISCQVDAAELDVDGIVTLEDISRVEGEKKDRQKKADLNEYVKSKKIHDSDDVQIVNSMNDRELAPNDEVMRDSPRKINTSRSSARGQLSVRIMEPGEQGGVGMGVTQVIGEGEASSASAAANVTAGAAVKTATPVAASKKGSDVSPQPSRPTSSEDTARVTVVPTYGGGNSKGAPQTSREDSGDGMVSGEGKIESRIESKEDIEIVPISESLNPFSDAFTNIPEMAVTVPPENVLDTTRTGISEISDNMNNTGWNFGEVREWKSTKIREIAAKVCQAFIRMVVVAPKKVAQRKRAIKAEEERKKMKEMKEEEEIDYEFNELVDENARLGEENASMTYEIDTLRKELEFMKRSVREKEEAEKHEGKGSKAKKKGHKK